MPKKIIFLTALCFLLSLGVWDIDHVYAQKRMNIKFSGKRLTVQGKVFPIKGINDSILPIGGFYAGPPNGACAYTSPGFVCTGLDVYDLGTFIDQEMFLVNSLGANTYRTFGMITPSENSTSWSSEVLKSAKKYDIMVIAGYWMNNFDYTKSFLRTREINKFVNYVSTLRRDPNYDKVLMIGLTNENNIRFCQGISNCNKAKQAAAFYSLVNEMARRAKRYDPDPRPIMVVSAELGDIGNATMNASDKKTPYIDAWGINVYRGKSFKGLFGQYARKSKKPLVVTEFGMDAWDKRGGGWHDPETQADWIGRLWNELRADYRSRYGVSAGGCVFQIVDNWWQANMPNLWVPGVAKHEAGGWANGGLPDGQFDVEYSGLIERRPNAFTVDQFVPREAAYVTQQKMQLQW